MEYVSEPRKLKAPFKARKPKRTKKTKENKDVKVENKKKPTSRKTTPDKYIYGHPHRAAKPFDSMTKFPGTPITSSAVPQMIPTILTHASARSATKRTTSSEK
jgi:hypothetical protein